MNSKVQYNTAGGEPPAGGGLGYERYSSVATYKTTTSDNDPDQTAEIKCSEG